MCLSMSMSLPLPLSMIVAYVPRFDFDIEIKGQRFQRYFHFCIHSGKKFFKRTFQSHWHMDMDNGLGIHVYEYVLNYRDAFTFTFQDNFQVEPVSCLFLSPFSSKSVLSPTNAIKVHINFFWYFQHFCWYIHPVRRSVILSLRYHYQRVDP